MATAAVYRSYDQKALDKAYDNRGRFPDTEDCKAAQSQGSDQCKVEYECKLDVRFGDGETDLLDIYLGEGTGPRPIHGRTREGPPQTKAGISKERQTLHPSDHPQPFATFIRERGW